MRHSLHSRHLWPRANNNDQKSSSHVVPFVIAAVVLVIVIPAIIYLILRRFRRYHYEPKYIPGSYLKRKWQEWAPRGRYSKVASRRQNRANSHPSEYAPNPVAAEEARATNAAAAGVDRNTSVRSVMTLPAYSSIPKPTEQVIGREGERAGMDVVAEFPETIEEAEALREEEMESLYQIRVTRRQEIADREARRQARREARERGDFQTLEQLRQESRARASVSSNNLTAAAMLAEHQSRGRQRRTSAVSYAEVGLVHHDGTRVRSTSQDSERGGLLAGAAPMGDDRPSLDTGRTSQESGLSHLRPHLHHRSGSSGLSISTSATELEGDAPTPPIEEPTTGRRASAGARSSQSSDPTSSSSPGLPRLTPTQSNSEGDIGESAMPVPISEPPDYDNLEWGTAPPYSSPVQNRGENVHVQSLERELAERSLQQGGGSGAVNSRSEGIARIPTLPPQLPNLTLLPSISVHSASEPNTPASPNQQH